ncbi:hypothetical protein C3408_22410 [Candidatus Pantoea alvi]|nr:hypothetical protein C3408_22410 [Pantoea alvi]
MPALTEECHAELAVALRAFIANPLDYPLSRSQIMEVARLALPILEQQEKGGWIEWKGGDCPVGNYAEVEYRTRLGNKWKNQAGWLRWVHEGLGGDIIAYRVVEQQERERGEDE